MNKKIRNYSALALATAAVLPLGCKKSSDDNGTNTIDDPNVTVNAINVTLSDNNPAERHSGANAVSYATTNIDVDNNGVTDFQAVLTYYKHNDTIDIYSALLFKGDSANIASGYYISDAPAIKAMTTSETMDNATKGYNESYFSLYEKYGTDIYYDIKAQFRGKGDKYFGIKFKKGAEVHFGWMKVNMGADGKSLIIKEVAYDTRANTPVKIGTR